MTLLEIRNQLFSHFLTSDTFVVETDVKKIKVGKKQLSFHQSLVFSVLNDLVKDGVCNKIEDCDGKVVSYVLGAPLGADGQDVAISNYTAEIVANIVNQYRDSIGEENGLVDKTAINEMDIQNLCGICQQLLNSMDDDNKDLEEDNDE